MNRSDSSSELSDQEYRALADFRRALRSFLRFSEEAARAEGLAPHQHQLLLAIRGWGHDTAPSISDMAEALQLRHHSAVELVQRAERAGLVRLRRDPNDKRRQLLELTVKGHRKLAKLSVLHRDELRRFRRHLADLLGAIDE
jgi:DNA-binding MarR family transcriptional regulator